MRAADGGDVAYGGRGNDLIAGGDGADRLKGGSDSDQVNGGDGPDRASGNKGADDVSGGEGDDSLFGGWGADRVYGGSGNDELHALAADGDVDLLQCGPGRDKAWVLARRASPDADRGLRGDLPRRRRLPGSGGGRERRRRHGGRRVVPAGQPRCQTRCLTPGLSFPDTIRLPDVHHAAAPRRVAEGHYRVAGWRRS